VDLKGKLSSAELREWLVASSNEWRQRLDEASRNKEIISLLNTSLTDARLQSEKLDLASVVLDILALEASPSWVEKLRNPGIIVSMTDTTKWTSEFAALKTELDLSTRLSLYQFEQLLTNPDIRILWDKQTLSDYEIFNATEDYIEQYSIIKAVWPLKNRDFVERCYKKQISDDTLVLYYHSFDSDVKPETDAN
jgi:hypothetical protein